MKKLFLFVSLAATLTSCYSTSYLVEGNYQLRNTTSNASSDVAKTQDGTYTDEYVTLAPQVGENRINMTIVNNHNSSIRVLWDEAAYIDNRGSSHRVIHMGVKLIDKEKAQVPSVIPQGAKIDDVLAPSDGIVNDGGVWTYIPLADNKFTSQTSAQKVLTSYKTDPYTTETKLLLPIEVNGNKIEYMLSFIGNDFTIKELKELDMINTYATGMGITLGLALLAIPLGL